MTPQHGTHSARQAGQALVECLLVLLALLPLWWLLPMLGKYQQVSHATLMASRYAAFDAGWFPVDGDGAGKTLADRTHEASTRFLADPWQPIRTSSAGAAPHPAWRTPDGRPLVMPAQGIGLRIEQQPLALPLLLGPAGARAGAAAMGLPSPVLTQATLSIPLQNLSPGLSLFEPFDRLDLAVQAHTALMHGAWTARSPAAVEHTITPLTPLRAVAASGMAQTLATALPWFELDGVSAPQWAHLPLWRDLVPADRLHKEQP